MKNWEMLKKKINEMGENEILEVFENTLAEKMLSILNLKGKENDYTRKNCIRSNCISDCSICKKRFLQDEYQPPKQEKWIIHRTLRTNGMETYVGYSDDATDDAIDGFRKYFLGTFDGKNISGYLHKLKAHKFNYLEAVVLRKQLNKQRAYKQYLWVISKVEE